MTKASGTHGVVHAEWASGSDVKDVVVASLPGDRADLVGASEFKEFVGGDQISRKRWRDSPEPDTDTTRRKVGVTLRDPGLKGCCIDLAAAFRQVPCTPAHSPFSVIAVYSPEKAGTEWYLLDALAFGQRAAV